VPRGTTYADLVAQVERRESIRVMAVGRIDYELETHADTNPPRPMTTPVVSATELFGYGFKRLQVRLLTRSFPPGAKVVTDDPV
jgi:hypothetical protein